MARTTNTRRVAQSRVDGQAARDRISNALSVNSNTQNRPATYGNVRPKPATARQRAENAAYGDYRTPATTGRKAGARKATKGKK